MKYGTRRTETVGNRILLIEQRLTKKYSPSEAAAIDSAPAVDIRTTPNGNGVPSPYGSVATGQSLHVVRAFACDDGAPIHLQYDGRAFREPGGRSLGGQSRSASSTIQALQHHFEGFGDGANPSSSPAHAGTQPTIPAENKALQGQNGGMVPASNQVPSRDSTPSSSGNPSAVQVNTAPAAQIPSPQHISSPNKTTANAPQSAAPDWDTLARVAPQNLPPKDEDTFVSDLQGLLSEARRRANTGQETPALSPAPAGQAVVPPAVTPPAPPQPTAPTAASPAAQAQIAGTDTADRHALFDQLGHQMQRAVTFDLGTVPVDKTFAAIEASIDAQEAQAMQRARARRKPVQAKPLSPIETVEDLALSTAPRQTSIRDSYTYDSPSNIVTQQSNYSVALNPAAAIAVAQAAEIGLAAISVAQAQASASQGSFKLPYHQAQRLLTTEARVRMPGSQSAKRKYSYRLLYFGIDRPLIEAAKADVIIEWEGNAYGEIGTPIITKNLWTSTDWSRSSADTTIVKVDRIPLPQTDPRTWPIVYAYEGTYDPLGNGHFEFRGEFEINAFGGLKFNRHEVVSRSLADWALGDTPQDYVQRGQDVIVPVPAIPQEQLDYLKTRLP